MACSSVGEAQTLEDRRGAGFGRPGVDVGEPCLDVGDACGVGGGFGFRQQGGAFGVGGKHGIEKRDVGRRDFLRDAADARAFRDTGCRRPSSASSPRISRKSVVLPVPLRPTKPDLVAGRQSWQRRPRTMGGLRWRNGCRLSEHGAGLRAYSGQVEPKFAPLCLVERALPAPDRRERETCRQGLARQDAAGFPFGTPHARRTAKSRGGAWGGPPHCRKEADHTWRSNARFPSSNPTRPSAT